MVKTKLRQSTIDKLVEDMAAEVMRCWAAEGSPSPYRCYPIPRGGVPVAYMLREHCDIEIVSSALDADFFVDDLIDSGKTYRTYTSFYGKPFHVLIDKANSDYDGQWVEFPWETELALDMETTVTRLLQQIGEDVERGGLAETPRRVAEAWRHWASGYTVDPKSVLKEFEDGGDYDNMVIVDDIPFYSHCEHHLAPFFGTVRVGYVPNGKIVGLSKVVRLVDVFAHRLQVQERLTKQIAHSLLDGLAAKGVGVRVKARHLCMESRGVRKQGHTTVTTELLGVFRDGTVRQEFLAP